MKNKNEYIFTFDKEAGGNKVTIFAETYTEAKVIFDRENQNRKSREIRLFPPEYLD